MSNMNLISLDNISEYLDGTKFSSSLDIKLKKSLYEEKTRIEKLLEILKGKRVIHLGFTDHIPLIAEKIKKGQWLHGLLDRVCSECYGVDINLEAVDYVKSNYNYPNVICADISATDILKSKSGVWDFILLGEILEHIDNPVSFIKGIRMDYEGKINKIVVTVPNILNVSAMNYMKKGIEHINTDHRYWFTPYTILKVLKIAGYKNPQIYYVNRCRLPFFLLAKRKIKTLFGLKSLFFF
ncbi:class I SAM-dependent methyltransferase [Parabacteroides sp. ASD2025]|uniref:class I SAM-dependent methyltransferase n=1 Tax=Parabacteroides sp. ASD2025 TaxID=3415987 RepID=UPI003CFA7AFA